MQFLSKFSWFDRIIIRVRAKNKEYKKREKELDEITDKRDNARKEYDELRKKDNRFLPDGKVTRDGDGIGFKLGNTALKDQVQKTLDEMYADGTVSKIAENYSSYGVPGSLIKK